MTVIATDSIFDACVAKVDEAIYELESPAQAGNLNSTPEYTLSMIEKATNNATARNIANVVAHVCGCTIPNI